MDMPIMQHFPSHPDSSPIDSQGLNIPLICSFIQIFISIQVFEFCLKTGRKKRKTKSVNVAFVHAYRGIFSGTGQKKDGCMQETKLHLVSCLYLETHPK
jgi:hypothetical protein